MLSKKYIHYGSDHFVPKRFNTDFDDSQYENCGWHWSKPFNPKAGLWASPEICHYPWINFCVDEHFDLSNLNSSFIFTIKHPENIFHVYDERTLCSFIRGYMKEYDRTRQSYIETFIKGNQFPSPIGIYFNKLIEDGFVALEVDMSMYWKIRQVFMGWDCDSILVFKPNEVIEVR